MKTLTTLLITASMLPLLAGCEKARLDQQVKELCAKDGGVKVYETVKLPADRFDQWGNVQIPAKEKVKPRDEYVYENHTTYLREGNPSLRRSHTKIIRRTDGKILGEAVSYHRVGGDMPGPWHTSSFACPKPTEIHLEKSIFTREILK